MWLLKLEKMSLGAASASRRSRGEFGLSVHWSHMQLRYQHNTNIFTVCVPLKYSSVWTINSAHCTGYLLQGTRLVFLSFYNTRVAKQESLYASSQKTIKTKKLFGGVECRGWRGVWGVKLLCCLVAGKQTALYLLPDCVCGGCCLCTTLLHDMNTHCFVLNAAQEGGVVRTLHTVLMSGGVKCEQEGD